MRAILNGNMNSFKTMETFILISMFVTFVASNDVLNYGPQGQDVVPGSGNLVDKWEPPSFCNGNDCPAYTVGRSTADYEERIYSRSNWVSTDLIDVNYRATNYRMFMKLFRYIRGGNDKQQKIAMTCPVTRRITPSQGPAHKSNYTMSFFISPSVSLAPQPTNKDVYIQQQSSQHVYVKEFSGFTPNFESWSKQAVALGEALDKDGLSYETAYYYTAGYDAPFKRFNRHNEIWFMKK